MSGYLGFENYDFNDEQIDTSPEPMANFFTQVWNHFEAMTFFVFPEAKDNNAKIIVHNKASLTR